MDYMNLRNEFLNDIKISNNETLSNIQKLFWDRLKEKEDELGYSVEEVTNKDQYINLLSSLSIYSAANMYSVRYQIMKYLTFLEGKNVKVDKQDLQALKYEELNTNNEYKLIYFSSFEQLQKALNDTIDNGGRYSKDSFLGTKAMIYLFWFGITMSELIEITKDDIDLKNNRVYLSKTQRYVNLPQHVIKILKEYANMEGFESQAKTIIFISYVKSIYLFRTNRNPQLTLVLIKKMLGRLNALSDETKFRYECIRRSGIFSRLYSFELENEIPEDLEVLQELMCESFAKIGTANLRLRDYKTWKSIFFA